jgi:FtsP/CotA-like multicopper oxidase with cupredoxin domain
MSERTSEERFSTETEGLEEATRPEVIRLRDGETHEITVQPVRKRIDDDEVRMLGYNGSIPGPTLHVDEGSEVTIEATNLGDVDATLHWHGLRLENRFDGVPEETQAPIPHGGTFTYRLQFPDPGFYWYHPHVREDFAQEMGLYAGIIVEPSDPYYWPPVDRQLAITLDDVLIEHGQMAPFERSGPTFTAMGRFGNVMLINGETEYRGEAEVGEVVRLNLVNTANTRIFNFGLNGARMKLVGGDSGRVEREELIDEILLSPSERAIVDVVFDQPGEVTLENRTPDRTYNLGHFAVSGEASGDAATAFNELRTDPELSAERERIQADLEREPDKTLAFVSQMPILYGGEAEPASSYVCPMHPEVTDIEASSCPKCGMTLVPDRSAPTSYVCPMHPDVTASEPATCPKCGMKLVPVTQSGPTSYVCPMHPDVTDTEASSCPECGMKLVPADAMPGGSEASHEEHEREGHEHGGHEAHDHADGLEWEDLMPEINRQTNTTNMIWQLIDRETGAENAAITWAFRVGDRIKIRLANEMDQEHPMHHPFHIHGAGRFLVLSRDGEPETNLVWKDTVLLRAGQTIDILLDVTNPGLWMAHCHIAEHTESGMMFSFEVAPATDPEIP